MRVKSYILWKQSLKTWFSPRPCGSVFSKFWYGYFLLNPQQSTPSLLLPDFNACDRSSDFILVNLQLYLAVFINLGVIYDDFCFTNSCCNSALVLLRPDTYRELSGDGVKTNVDGVLKVRGGGDLGPVLVPVLLPASCRWKVKGHQCNSRLVTFFSLFFQVTFLRGKHGDDLVSGLPLLRYGWQRPRAVIGWLRVLGSSSLAAHPDRGGGGLVLTHSAVTHLHTGAPAAEEEKMTTRKKKKKKRHS